MSKVEFEQNVFSQHILGRQCHIKTKKQFFFVIKEDMNYHRSKSGLLILYDVKKLVSYLNGKETSKQSSR